MLYTYNLLLIKEYPRSLTQNGHPNAIQLCSAALRINWQNDRAKGKEDELHKRKDGKRDREREKNIDWSSKSVAVACRRVERSTTNLAEPEDGDKSSGLWLFLPSLPQIFLVVVAVVMFCCGLFLWLPPRLGNGRSRDCWIIETLFWNYEWS